MAIDPIKQMYAQRERELVEKLKSYKAPRDNFVASELASCRLAMVYRLSGYIPVARTPRGEDYGDDGNLHHDAVRNKMRKAGVRLGDMKFNKDGTVDETGSYILNIKHKGQEFKIAMRLDGTIMIGTVKHTLEIKSLGYWKYNPILKVWNDKNNPGSAAAVLAYLNRERRDMIAQVHANMVATGLKKAYLVFKDRSDCALGLHGEGGIAGGVVVPFSQTLWDGVLDKLAYVRRHIKNKTLPEPDFAEEVAECRWCNYYHLCHGARKRRQRGLEPGVLHPQLGEVIHVRDLK